jgi:hypothetical protein
VAIYDPRLFLSRDDRELLRLLGEILLTCEGQDHYANCPSEAATLSDAEAAELLGLLESFVSSKKFVEGSYFVEKLFSDDSLYSGELRDIYLSWRRRYGGSRAVATIQWENLLGRVGLWTRDRGNPNLWYRASASPMSIDHFLKMERKLADAANLHPRVKSLILDFVEARSAAIDEIRFGRAKLKQGQVSQPPKKLLSEIKDVGKDSVGPAPLSTAKLAGVMIIVLDFSALFTTRDWSVAGFLSTIAGALPAASLD